MDTEIPKRTSDEAAVARASLPVAKTTRTQTAVIVVAAVMFAAALVALASAIVVSRQAAEREARVFGSTSAAAFREGACDRALRLVVAGLPGEGALPSSFSPGPCKTICRSSARRMIAPSDSRWPGHKGLVSGAAFSPDGASVVTSSWDADRAGVECTDRRSYCDAIRAQILDEQRGVQSRWRARRHRLMGQDGARVGCQDRRGVWQRLPVTPTASMAQPWVNGAAFSADGGRIVTASFDGTARVWDAQRGKLLAILAGHTDRIVSAKFSRDGSRIVTASADHTARIWDADGGTVLATLTGPAGEVVAAAFSPDSTQVVAASLDHSIYVSAARPAHPDATGPPPRLCLSRAAYRRTIVQRPGDAGSAAARARSVAQSLRPSGATECRVLPARLRRSGRWHPQSLLAVSGSGPAEGSFTAISGAEIGFGLRAALALYFQYI